MTTILIILGIVWAFGTFVMASYGFMGYIGAYSTSGKQYFAAAFRRSPLWPITLFRVIHNMMTEDKDTP